MEHHNPFPKPTTGDISRATMVTVPTIVTTVFAVILTALRFYVRIYMIKMVEWDDWFNLLGTMCSVAVMGLVMAAASSGLGRHAYYLVEEGTFGAATNGILLLRIAEFLLIFSTIFVKISISLFLKRLFIQSQRWQVFFWLFIAFNTITSAIDAIAIFPQCTPVEFNWDKSVPGGTCWSDAAINALGIAQGTIAAVTDVFLSVLPIMFLWNLKMLLRVKLGICAIMALGFASGGFAAARTALVPSLTATHDPTWDLAPLFMWAVLEGTFGVIAAAAPSVRPLLGRNAMSTDKYSGSKGPKSQPRSVPLHSMPSHISSRRSWLPGSQNANMRKLQDEEDVELRGSDGSSNHSQVGLWDNGGSGGRGGGIVKTTDIKVTHAQVNKD